MKSEPGFVIFGQFCFKVDNPHLFPNATRPLFLKPLCNLYLYDNYDQFSEPVFLPSVVRKLGRARTQDGFCEMKGVAALS
jgi:hypothetical protein